MGILALIAGILGVTLNFVARAWERGGEDVEDFRKMRIVMDRTAEQLKSAFPYWTKKDNKWKVLFSGDSQTLSFVSPLSVQSPLVSGLIWVQYSLGEDEEGKKCFIVRETPMMGEETFGEPEIGAVETGSEIVFLSGIETLTFEYFILPDDAEEGEWRESWQTEEEEWAEDVEGTVEETGMLLGEKEEEPSLPQAVRITLKQSAKDPEAEPLITAMTIPLIALPDRETAFSLRQPSASRSAKTTPPSPPGYYPKPGQTKPPGTPPPSPRGVPPRTPFPFPQPPGGER